MSTKDKFAAPFGGLTFKDWQIFARNHLELMLGAVLGAETLYKGWYDSGLSPYEAADLAFSHKLDSIEAEAIEKQEAAQAKEERNLKASVKSFNTIDTILEDAQYWTIKKLNLANFTTWLKGIERELALLTNLRLPESDEWNYIHDYEMSFNAKQTAARIYAKMTQR